MTNSLLCSAALLLALFFMVTQAPAQWVASPTGIGDLFFTGAAAGDNFGWSVSSAGDVNGDGFSDMIVGAPFNDAGATNRGRAYIYFGGVSMDTTADVTLIGAAANDNFGRSVSSAGDVNGDGYGDVIVGAPFNDAGATNRGRAYIFFGGVSMDTTADVTLTGAAANDNFGVSVASAGDVNGDSYSDVIVGAYLNDAGGSNAGRAYIFFGGVSMDNTADVLLTGAATFNLFGISVSSAGDVNGDGKSDVIVGAEGRDSGGTDAGRAYVYHGGVSMDNTADDILTGAAAGDGFGYSVGTAGDVDGDGKSDVIAGAYGNDAGGTDAGSATVRLGTAPDTVPDISFSPAPLYFGIEIIGNSKDKILLVSNVGTATLYVGSLFSSVRYTVDTSSFTLSPGESRNVVVTFTPDHHGNHNGYLIISSNDPDEGKVFVSLRGIGMPDSALNLDPAKALSLILEQPQVTKSVSSGGTSYVTIPDSNSLDLTTSYTIEAWINPSAFQILGGIVGKYHTPGANGYTLRLGSNSPYTGINFDEMETPTGILTANQWYHIAAVNDSGTRHLYVNGVEQPLSGTPLTPQANTDPLTIGVDYLPSPRYFYGTIEEVRLWDVARTERQIRENMHTVPMIDSLTGIVSYWQFNEGTGDTTIDVIRLNNGTLVNAPAWVASTIPFGGGTSNTQVVGSLGLVDFTGTDLAMNFTAKSGTDTFVVTKINLMPSDSTLPVGILSVYPRYWIARQYGGGTFTGNLTFTLGAGTISPGDSAVPTKLKLLKRNSNTATDSAWIILTSAASATLITGEVTFENISGFNQFAIGTTGDSPLPVEEERVPYEFRVYQNYPNPFNPLTVIRYELPVQSHVTLKVFNVLGQEVAVLVDGMQEAGFESVEWDASRFASGVYFYRLDVYSSGNPSTSVFSETRKLLLLK